MCASYVLAVRSREHELADFEVEPGVGAQSPAGSSAALWPQRERHTDSRMRSGRVKRVVDPVRAYGYGSRGRPNFRYVETVETRPREPEYRLLARQPVHGKLQRRERAAEARVFHAQSAGADLTLAEPAVTEQPGGRCE